MPDPAIAARVLIVSNCGAGKSWLASTSRQGHRGLFEAFHGSRFQLVSRDGMADFSNLFKT